MALKFIEIDSNSTKPKATIHITGKLGFNMEGAKLMELSDTTYYRIATDDDTEVNNVMYFVSSTADEKGSVKVAKAGLYFYINLGSVFSKLGFKYENFIISFDISKDEYEGKPMFVLKKRKREKPRETGSDKDNDKDED